VAATPRLADALASFVFEGAAVRGALVSLDACCRDILACHPYPPALRRVLAELLAAAALLASTLKFRGSLVVQLQGTGPVRMLVVECDATLALRATAQWKDEAETLAAGADLATLAGAPADARLAITLDPKDGGPLYQGIVGLETASIAALIEHYLTSSEQIDSRLFLATTANGARGVLLQRLPSAGPADLAAWEGIAAEASALGAGDLLAAGDAASFLSARFAKHDVRLFDPRPLRFACGCSEERIAGALRLLGRAEVESILAEQGMVGVTCEFCNRHYTFVASDARALFGREPGGRLPVTPPDPPAH
jgi:molecular chaperone Hsp33